MPKQRVGTAYVSIRAKMDKLDKDLADAKSMTMRSANAIQKSVSNIFKGAIAYASVSAVTSFAKSIFETGKEVARLEKSYKEITGSAAAANAEFKFLRDTADQLGQNFYSLADQYKNFMAASRGSAMEGMKTRDAFVAIVKAGTTLGLSNEKIVSSLQAVQKMMTTGVVQADEFNVQLAEALPVAMAAAREATGKTVQEFRKMMEQGKLISEEFIPKFSVALGKFSGKADDATAASNKLEEGWKDLKRAIGEAGIFELQTKLIKEFGDTLKDKEFIEAIKYTAMMISDLTNAFIGLGSALVYIPKQMNDFFSWFGFGLNDFAKDWKQYKDAVSELSKYPIPEWFEKKAKTYKIGPDTPGYGDMPENDALKIKMPPSISTVDLIKRKGTKGIKDQLTDEQKAWKDFYENLDDLRLKAAAQQMEMDDDEIQARKDFAKRLLQLQDEVNVDRRLTDSEKDRLAKIIKNLEKEQTAMVEMTEETARAMQDAFSTFFFDAFTGELDDLGDYADAIFKSIAQAAASYMGQMVAFGNTGKGGLFGVDGLLAGLFHSGGKVGYDTPQSRSVNPLIFAGAPRLHGGLMPDEFPAILQRGETVLPKGYGGGAVFNMQVINNTGANVTESRTPNGTGGFDIQVMIDQAVADKLGRRGSMSNKVLRNTYGAREGVIAR